VMTCNIAAAAAAADDDDDGDVGDDADTESRGRSRRHYEAASHRRSTSAANGHWSDFVMCSTGDVWPTQYMYTSLLV